jgi:hypothetical protein
MRRVRWLIMADAGHGFRNRNSLDSRPLRDYIGAIDQRTELIDGCEGRNDKPAFVRALSFLGKFTHQTTTGSRQQYKLA